MKKNNLKHLKYAIYMTTAMASVSSTAQGPAQRPAEEAVLNLYSARHYPTDTALYENFTNATGIKINRIDADDAGIINRLRAEGKSSPADVILLVDAARLTRADDEGLFKPMKSKVLDEKIPSNFRAKPTEQGVTWTGFSTRARIVVFDKETVKPTDVSDYEQLSSPINKGKICTRSGSHPYNLSLFSSLLVHWGDVKTQAFLNGMVANMARSPKGGDVDQIKAINNGECAIALSNSYYVARLLRSTKPDDIAMMEKIGIVFPNQKTWGTHQNIAGGAVAKYAVHPNNALAFLEYLASDSAQHHFANGNNEWPIAKGLNVENPVLAGMVGEGKAGAFKSENIPLSLIGQNQGKIQTMLDKAGYK